jgi:hypothetical protein
MIGIDPRLGAGEALGSGVTAMPMWFASQMIEKP